MSDNGLGTTWRPVFIGGCGRSGTTRLVDLLGCHPQLSPIYETEFVRQVINMVLASPDPGEAGLAARIRRLMHDWSKDLPFRPHAKHAHETYRHGAHYIRFSHAEAMEETERLLDTLRAGRPAEGLRRFVLGLFALHAAHDGKPYWINKVPRYVLMLPAMKALFPDLRFIHCVRDPRDVALSLVGRNWGHKSVQGAAQYWRQCVEAGLAFAERHPASYHEVRLEDLLLAGPATVARVVAWLGLAPDAAMERAVEELTGTTPERRRLHRWEEEMAEPDRRFVGREMAGLLRRFDYAP